MKLIMLTLFTFALTPAVGQCAPLLVVDGVRVKSDPPPIIRRGRIFVPESFFRKLGLGAERKSAAEVIVFWPASDVIYDFQAGKQWVPGLVQNVRIKISAAPFLWRNTLMMPLKELLGDTFRATWTPSRQTLFIYRDRSWMTWRIDEEIPLGKKVRGYSDPVLPSKPLFLPLHAVAEAEQLDASGKWQEAVKLLQQVVKLYPYNWSDRGYRPDLQHYLRLGTIQTREKPQDWQGYFNLGIAEAIDEKYDKAEELFRRSAEINPRIADVQWAIGWAIIRQDNPYAMGRNPETLQKAADYFEKALEIDPNHRRALSSSGHVYLTLAFLVNRNGGYNAASREEAKVYLLRAQSRLERLINGRSDQSRLHYLLMDISSQLGEWDRAMKHYFGMNETARKENMERLAYFYDRLGRPDKAEEIRRLNRQNRR